MLYCDAIVDAMTKGLGKQKICVRYNIITSSLDVILLFILLPKYGMRGYFVSFLVTHLLNFCLSIRLLLKLVGQVIRPRMAAMCILSAICGILAAQWIKSAFSGCIVFIIVFATFIRLLGIINKRDIQWIKRLITNNQL